MIDSTPSGAVVDQSPTGTAQLMVEKDTGSQAENALQNALSDALCGAPPVTLQGERALAGPEDGLDTLADRSQVRSLPGLVFSSRPRHGGSEVPNSFCELPAGVAFVPEERLPACAHGAGQEFQPHLPLVTLGGSKTERPGSAVCGEDGVQTEAPEIAGVRGTVAVIGHVAEGRALNRLSASRTLHRRRVDEEKIVRETRALAGKNLQEPLQGVAEPTPPLVVARLLGNLGEEVTEVLIGKREEPAIRGDPQHGLGHTQCDHLGVGDLSSPISPLLWQKVIGCTINNSAESVEVGVHRGLRVDGVLDTADFGLSAFSSFPEVAFLVESVI